MLMCAKACDRCTPEAERESRASGGPPPPPPSDAVEAAQDVAGLELATTPCADTRTKQWCVGRAKKNKCHKVTVFARCLETCEKCATPAQTIRAQSSFPKAIELNSGNGIDGTGPTVNLTTPVLPTVALNASDQQALALRGRKCGSFALAGAMLASAMDGVSLDAASYEAVVDTSALMAALRDEWDVVLADCHVKVETMRTDCLCGLCTKVEDDNRMAIMTFEEAHDQADGPALPGPPRRFFWEART